MFRRTPFLTLLALLLALALGRSALHGLRINRAFLMLNHAEATENIQLLEHSQTRLLKTGSARHGLALTYIRQRDEDRALAAWLAAGGTAEALLARGKRLSFTQGDEAIIFYRLAQRLQPDNPEVWLAIGRLCQPNPTLDPICREAIHRNGGNLFINADLTHGREGWLLKSPDQIAYRFNVCEQRDCVRWTTSETDPLPAVSQCVALSGGHLYAFTAELKIDAPHETMWRPLYFQGTIDGVSQDFWLQAKRGTADWQTWRYEFTAPHFDNAIACFYPIRTSGAATVAFRQPRLIALEQ